MTVENLSRTLPMPVSDLTRINCWLSEDVAQIIALQPALRFNGGGHINHSIFWKNLSPNGGGVPKGDLLDAIKANFRSFDVMKQELSAVTIAIQGSGWGWLGLNPANGRLKIVTCANQDPLQPTTGNKWKLIYTNFGIIFYETKYKQLESLTTYYGNTAKFCLAELSQQIFASLKRQHTEIKFHKIENLPTLCFYEELHKNLCMILLHP